MDIVELRIHMRGFNERPSAAIDSFLLRPDDARLVHTWVEVDGKGAMTKIPDWEYSRD